MNQTRLLFVFVVLCFLGACSPATAPTALIPEPTTLVTLPNTVTPLPPQNTATPAAPTAVPPTANATPVPPTPVPTPIGELKAETNAAWAQFVSSLEADAPVRAQERVNEFWDLVSKYERVPLILDDAAIFLYKGDASTVTWRGDFSFWESGTGLEGKRIGETDLWYTVADFPRDSRTDYKIVLDGSRWILDPANPHLQSDGTGDNNVLTMPDFKVTDFTERRDGVPAGTLTDWIPFESKVMGTTVNYRVYTPPNYESVDHLSTLYVTDGENFSNEQMGAVQIVLDNLIADEKIVPLIAVFIDARDAKNPDHNLRETQFLAQPEKFAGFIVDELVSTIDARHRTNPTREARALVGTSYGGVFATYAGLKNPQVFGNLAIFSPAYWVLSNPDGVGQGVYSAGARRMNQFIQSALKTKSTMPLKIFTSTGLLNWDVGDLEFMAKPLRERGDTVKIFQVREGHSWGAWSGLTDEMLEYLFPLQ